VMSQQNCLIAKKGVGLVKQPQLIDKKQNKYHMMVRTL
jgi:hypothetical protein